VASRAEGRGVAVPARSLPRLGRVVRAAMTDFYFNSLRLVPANVVWGAWVIIIVLVGMAWPMGGIALLALLALPTAGIFRVAARIVRVEPDVSLRDIAWPYRHGAGTTILLGAASVGISFVLGSNVVVGLIGGEPFGWLVATLAGWGLIALWCGALVAWPLIADPARAAWPLRERVRLAGRLLLIDPLRWGALGLAAAVLVAISVALTAAILTVGVAFVALVACRSVYPAADRLELALAGGERQ
jgi:hypothetical protein